MPVKFVVQMKRTAVMFRLPKWLSRIEIRTDVWVDTPEWPSLALAREKFPEYNYREVMVQW